MSFQSCAKQALYYLNKFGSICDKPMKLHIDNGMEVSPLFIIGLPRSGTTLLYQVMINNFHLAYFNHLMDYFYGLPYSLARISKHLSPHSPFDYKSEYGHIRGILSPSESPNFWFHQLGHFNNESHEVGESSLSAELNNNLYSTVANISTIQGKQYVYKCVYLLLNIDLLNKIFQSSRFLIIERDPLTVCRSIYVARKKQLDSQAWWSIRPPGHLSYMNKPVTEQIVYQVTYCRDHLRRALTRIENERYCHINYEELCADPIASIQTIKDWLSTSTIKLKDQLHLPPKFNASTASGLTAKESEELQSVWRDYHNCH